MELSSYKQNHLHSFIKIAEEYKHNHKGQETMIILRNCELEGFSLVEQDKYPIIYRTDTQEINPDYVPKPLEPPEPANCRAFFESRFGRCL